MNWYELEVEGRVTALRRGLCAGVGTDGRAFTCELRGLSPTPVAYDDVVLDSFGVVGASPGVRAWLTGRGSDGRLTLFGTSPELVGTPDQALAHPLAWTGATWATTVVDTDATYALAAASLD